MIIFLKNHKNTRRNYGLVFLQFLEYKRCFHINHKSQKILINLFFIEGYLLYRIWLSSVKPQHESAIGIHLSPPF